MNMKYQRAPSFARLFVCLSYYDFLIPRWVFCRFLEKDLDSFVTVKKQDSMTRTFTTIKYYWYRTISSIHVNVNIERFYSLFLLKFEHYYTESRATYLAPYIEFVSREKNSSCCVIAVCTPIRSFVLSKNKKDSPL